MLDGLFRPRAVAVIGAVAIDTVFSRLLLVQLP